MFAAVIVYFQTTGLTILDNGGPLLQSDILCYSLNIVHRKPPEFKKCEKLRKFFNCTQLSQKSEALRRSLVVYHLRKNKDVLHDLHHCGTRQLVDVSVAAHDLHEAAVLPERLTFFQYLCVLPCINIIHLDDEL